VLPMKGFARKLKGGVLAFQGCAPTFKMVNRRIPISDTSGSGRRTANKVLKRTRAVFPHHEEHSQPGGTVEQAVCTTRASTAAEVGVRRYDLS
jgi:hypothetical protein